MAKLFGFKLPDSGEENSKGVVSPIPKSDEDKSDFFVSSGFYGQYVDIEGVYKSEQDLIRRYREMCLHPEADSAIEDIVNEAIVSDLNDSPVEIELSNLPGSDKLKDAIRTEFKYIKELMNFDKKSHEIFRTWYIDGRVYYHKVIDLKKPEDGIQEIRFIDPLKIRLVRQIEKTGSNNQSPFDVSKSSSDLKQFESPKINEFYIFDPNTVTKGSGIIPSRDQKGSVKIAKDAITYVTSGLVDRNKQTVLSYLHKAIKALNQLRMVEDSLVIYRLSRAPERRIFYIDVGNLPKVKAEQYLRDVMNRYRNKLVYNADTGEIRDDKKYMAMLEDFWLPRREGGRGTEITTLPGGQNLGELTDIEYFQKKLYRALGVPESRIGADSGFNLGRSSEILRDELQFSKFVGRLRKRFAAMFNDFLKTQLILKNIVTPEDWKQMEDHIQYDFLYDNQFAELKESEMLQNRLSNLATIEPYIGKFYSTEYVRKRVLQQTDQEIEEIDMQIEDEIQKGILPNPAEVDPITGEPLPQEGQDLGEVPTDENPDAAAAQITDAQYQKDTKSAEL